MFEVLDAIREKPGMYLGHQSLMALRYWIAGFHSGRTSTGAAQLPDETEFAGFDSFVCEKYRWHDSGGWAAKIAYHHRNDAEAFDEFFKLLDEYRAAGTVAIQSQVASKL